METHKLTNWYLIPQTKHDVEVVELKNFPVGGSKFVGRKHLGEDAGISRKQLQFAPPSDEFSGPLLVVVGKCPVNVFRDDGDPIKIVTGKKFQLNAGDVITMRGHQMHKFLVVKPTTELWNKKSSSSYSLKNLSMDRSWHYHSRSSDDSQPKTKSFSCTALAGEVNVDENEGEMEQNISEESISPKHVKRKRESSDDALTDDGNAHFVFVEEPQGVMATFAENEENVQANKLEQDAKAILQVFPDCDPTYLYSLLLEEEYEKDKNRVDSVSNRLLENGYEKNKVNSSNAPIATEQSVNDDSKHRSEIYKLLSIQYLSGEFFDIPLGHIRKCFGEAKEKLIPTFRELMRQREETSKPYVALKVGRQKRSISLVDSLFEEEHHFLLNDLKHKVEQKDEEYARLLNASEYENTGSLIQCGCCYEEVPFDDMTFCQNGHLFCKSCANSAAKAILDNGKYELKCLETGCTCDFPYSEVQKFLEPKFLAFYESRLQGAALREAALENLETCPFCEFAMIIENPGDKVFKCLNERCKKESCRLCREESHIPLKCDEVVRKAERDYRSYIAEKMTEAFVRTCPKCHTRFFKTEGCNHMKCSCGLEMCYLCRKVIKGYDHFREPHSKCVLHTDTVKVDETAIKQAESAAKEQYLKEHPEIVDKVDISKPIVEAGKKKGSKRAKRK